MFFHVFFYEWFKGPLTYWLHSWMFFKVFLVTVQGSVDLLAPFFDILWCILIDGQLTHWLRSLMFFYVFWWMVQRFIDFILWCSSKNFYGQFNDPLTYWPHSWVFFQVFMHCRSWLLKKTIYFWLLKETTYGIAWSQSTDLRDVLTLRKWNKTIQFKNEFKMPTRETWIGGSCEIWFF